MAKEGRPEAVEGSGGRSRASRNCCGAVRGGESDSPWREDCALGPTEGTGDLGHRTAPRRHAL
eukprot:12965575-Alexandrium_andersonii.AAC.1